MHMTNLVILARNEIRKFDSPPLFNTNEQTLYFSLNSDYISIINGLRKPTNKVGFLLQLGYFKANGKFFTSEQFRQR